jgi:hypothetical protein
MYSFSPLQNANWCVIWTIKGHTRARNFPSHTLAEDFINEIKTQPAWQAEEEPIFVERSQGAWAPTFWVNVGPNQWERLRA